jgi:hypothetical protein
MQVELGNVAHDLPALIDAARATDREAWHRTDVDQLATLPEDRVLGVAAGEFAPADRLVPVVDGPYARAFHLVLPGSW